MLREGFYVVSGGASGIGLAICRAIAATGGSPVILDPKPLGDNETTAFRSYSCDITNESCVLKAVAELERDGRTIEGVVNCAGIAGPTAFAEDIEAEDWQTVLSTNVAGAAIVAKSIIPIMKKARRGALICVSSSCTRNGFPLRAPYVTSKAAVEMLAKTLAMELGPWGIRSNIVSPGIVEGPRLDAIIADQADKRGIPVPEVMAEFTARTSMKLAVSPEDIAKFVCFLFSEDARFVTGQTVGVCGNFEGYSSEMVAGPSQIE